MIFHGVPLDCINQAATKFHVSAVLIASVIQMEGGKNGLSSHNQNGTSDLGVMQVNSRWLHQLKSLGIDEASLKNNPCINVKVGTWILAKDMANVAGWKGVANYHSATPIYNVRYKQKLQKIYFQNQSVISREV